MSWTFLPLAGESSVRSQGEDCADLGVAVWYLTRYPRQEPEEAEYQVKVYEVDSLSRGDNASNEENDEVATLKFTIGAHGASVSVESEENNASNSDPTLELHFRLETDPPLERVPAARQVEIRVPRGDDPDFELEMGLLAPGQPEGYEDQVLLQVGTIFPFTRPDREVFEHEWDPAEFRTESGQRTNRPRHAQDGSWPIEDGEEFEKASDFRGYAHPRQTLWGQPIYWARHDNRTKPFIRITHHARLKITWWGGQYLGLGYGGDHSKAMMRRVANTMARELREDEPYQAVVALASLVLHEGGPSAINTYDDKIITLGSGYAGGRLTGFLNDLPPRCKDLLKRAFSGVPRFDDELGYDGDQSLTDEETRQLRYDVPAYAHFVRVAEHPTYGLDVARSNIREFVRFTLERDSQTDREWANAQAEAWLDNRHPITQLPLRQRAFRALVGVAGYLRHGTHSYMQDPTGAVRHAMSCAETPSAQLAVLLQRYTENIATARGNSDANTWSNRAMAWGRPLLGMRIQNFEEAIRDDGIRPWRIDASAFGEVIECLGTPRRRSGRPAWTHPSCWTFTRPGMPSESDDAEEGEEAEAETTTEAEDQTDHLYVDVYAQSGASGYLAPLTRWQSAPGQVDTAAVTDDSIRARLEEHGTGTITKLEYMRRLGHYPQRYDMGARAQPQSDDGEE